MAKVEAVQAPASHDRLPGVLHYRHLVWHLATSKIRRRFSGTRLGSLWLILSPLLFSLTLSLVMGVLLERSNPTEIIAYILTGVVIFDVFSGSSSGASAVIANDAAALLNVRYVPVTIFPVAHVIHTFVTFLYAFVAVIIVISVLNGPTWWSASLLYFPIYIAAMAVFALGLSLCFSIIGTMSPDLRNLMPFGVLLIYYTSPVFIPREVFDAPVFALYTSLNPVTAMLDVGRDIFIHATPPRLVAIGLIGAYGVVLTGLGVLLERRYGRRLVFYV